MISTQEQRRLRAPLVMAIAALLAMPACNQPEQAAAKPKPATAQLAAVRDDCARGSDHQQLKAIAFEKAAEVRSGDAALLARLAEGASVRIDSPAVRSRDDALNVTICRGRMVIDLPPGVADAFSGDRRLAADIVYAVQAAADGTRRLFRFEGAEPIIYRLAAIGLTGDVQFAALPPGPTLAAPVQLAAQMPPAATPPARPARPVPPPPVPRQVAQVREPEPPAWSGREPRLSARGRPSFDCRGAQSLPDRLVCADERLAALDRVTVSFYREAIDNTDEETRAILRDTASDFAARRASCRQPACVAAAYEDRMEEIDRIATLD